MSFHSSATHPASTQLLHFCHMVACSPRVTVHVTILLLFWNPLCILWPLSQGPQAELCHSSLFFSKKTQQPTFPLLVCAIGLDVPTTSINPSHCQDVPRVPLGAH
uniref:Macaca fascicularis brain cDNA clone: QtrA-15419, similar to human aarF domain containing kinase 1 (ADCK1), mRNA, RefSeq: NM_020421.2 n=1 Tax=Macaca fascicularis TaxID=9541 RepID=I7GEH5_MACFA|nr:unnamed protein product [Macaca fascicularis]